MPLNDAPEGYVTCPYEKHHQILISRLQFHLVKCQKVYKGELPLVQCPFNTTHKIPEIELNCHKNYTCPDRNKLEAYIVAAQQTTPLFPVKPIDVESTEDWDDINQPTYNPMERCKERPVLIHFQCEPPSMRKQCRSEERERLAKLTGSSGTFQETNSNQSTSSVRLPQTMANTYVDRRNTQVESIAVQQNNHTIPKMFGRGRGRILQ